MRRAAGATLVEVLVGSALLGLLLALAVQVFVPALQAWTRAQARSRAQQTVLAAARWLRTDLQAAAPTSVAVEDGKVAMIRQAEPPRFDDHGMPVWGRQIVYWLAEDGKLHRQVVLLDPGGTEVPELSMPVPDPASRVVGQHIEEFQAESSRTGSVRFRLTAALGDYRSSLSSTAASFHPLPPEERE